MGSLPATGLHYLRYGVKLVPLSVPLPPGCDEIGIADLALFSIPFERPRNQKVQLFSLF